MVELGHTPVLLNEVVQALNIKPQGTYVDATYGRGGHSRAIIQELAENATMIVLDRDMNAIAHAHEHLQSDERVKIFHTPFSKLSDILEELNLNGQVDGVLCDFGVSSPQLDDAERGFSFNAEGDLDMRMDVSVGKTAFEWLEETSESEMVRVFKLYGEERFSKRIARAIKARQLEEPIRSTKVLAKLIDEAVPVREPGKNPATRVFQAIRIVINDELGEVESVLPQVIHALKPGGRATIISFHSLEDRRVKRYFRDASKGDPFPPDLPVTAEALNPEVRLIGKPVRPSEEEIKLNPRSRSAVLRIVEKVS